MGESKPHKHTPSQAMLNPFQVLRGEVFCSSCGALGRYSNGQRKTGRPRKVFWRPAARSLLTEGTGDE
jgi:hypothetical protein